MQQFNHENGKVEGKPSYKFYMGGKGDRKDIVTADKDFVDLSGKRLDLMKQDAGVKSDAEYERDINETKKYNEDLLIPSEEANKFNLNGNNILVRLFKHETVKKIGNLYQPNKLIIPYQTEGGKIAKMENPLQFIHAGVINAISDQCSETFRSKFKVGDVVHLRMGINLVQQRCWLNPTDYYEEIFDNWFLVNENMIEKGIK